MFNTISNIEFIINSLLYSVQNEVPGVARGIKKSDLKKWKNYILLPILPQGYPWVPSKNISPFGSAVWPAIRNIYKNVLFYYIDKLLM